MQEVLCDQCGSDEFRLVKGYNVCKQCGAQFASEELAAEDADGSEKVWNRYRKAWNLLWEEQPEEAADAFRDALDLDPNNWRLQIGLAQASEGSSGWPAMEADFAAEKGIFIPKDRNWGKLEAGRLRSLEADYLEMQSDGTPENQVQTFERICAKELRQLGYDV